MSPSIGFGGLFVVSPIMFGNIVLSARRRFWRSYAFIWVVIFQSNDFIKIGIPGALRLLLIEHFNFWIKLNLLNI